MRTMLYITTFIGVIGLAFWAYHENYRTQAAIDEVEDLHGSIGAARERLSVLRAEWAYLNRPERLRDLAEINYARLGLVPLRADQFGRLDQVAYPPEPLLGLSAPIDVTSAGARRP